jgi:hypothetical protein
MFRSLDYDFTCPQCGEPDNGSQIVAGLSREEAQTNILTKVSLVCSHCGEPLLADADVHFSRNDASHLWNSPSKFFSDDPIARPDLTGRRDSGWSAYLPNRAVVHVARIMYRYLLLTIS